jgi:hypothetical protein
MMESGRYDDRSHSRHGSFPSSSYGVPVDPYAFESTRHRSHSRHRSASHHRDQHPSSHRDHRIQYPTATAVPIPGTNVIGPTAYGGSYGQHGSYGGGGIPISPHGSPVSYRNTANVPIPISPNYHGSSSLAVPISSSSRHRSSSMSVPYAPEYPAMMGQPQGVMLEPAPHRSSRRHKHRRSHSHGRSRSTEPPAIIYGGGYSSSARY